MKHWFIYGKQQASHLKIKLNISDIGLDIEKKISIDQVYSISVLLFFTLSSMQSPPHHHILSCSFGIYFCFFCLDLYDKHTRPTLFVCLVCFVWASWIFCAQPETSERITFSQGGSSVSSVIGHDEGASSRMHRISLVSETVRWRSFGRCSCTVMLNVHWVNLTTHGSAHCRPWASLQP